MTFSLVGKCGRTGMFGAAVTTSSIGVGCRVPYARAGVGAVCTQHRTDPRLGPRGLDMLAAGNSTAETIAKLTANDPTIGWRQLGQLKRIAMGVRLSCSSHPRESPNRRGSPHSRRLNHSGRFSSLSRVCWHGPRVVRAAAARASEHTGRRPMLPVRLRSAAY